MRSISIHQQTARAKRTKRSGWSLSFQISATKWLICASLVSLNTITKWWAFPTGFRISHWSIKQTVPPPKSRDWLSRAAQTDQCSKRVTVFYSLGHNDQKLVECLKKMTLLIKEFKNFKTAIIKRNLKYGFYLAYLKSTLAYFWASLVLYVLACFECCGRVSDHWLGSSHSHSTPIETHEGSLCAAALHLLYVL